MISLGKNWELSFDWHQWTVGFNYYPANSKIWGMGQIFNLFIGPIRVGWWNKK